MMEARQFNDSQWWSMRSRFLAGAILGTALSAFAGTAKDGASSPPIPESVVLIMSPKDGALRALKHDDRELEPIRTSATETRHELPMSLHDAFCYFGEVGSKEAVPLLIQNLASAEVVTTKSGRHLCECTWSHLVQALKAQTGKDFEFDQQAWQRWWESEGKNLPESHFDPKKHGAPVRNEEPAQPPKDVRTSNPSQAPAPASK